MLEYLRRPRFLIGLLSIIAGLDISVLLTKFPRLVGIIFIAVGALLIYLDLRESREAAAPEVRKVPRETTPKPRLSQRLVSKLSLDGRLVPFFWILGIIVVAADLAMNLSGHNSEIGSFDMIIIAFGATLVLYAPLSKKYPRELDFLIVFFAFLIVILIIPLWIVGNLSGNIEDLTSQQDIIYVLLTAPLSGILTILGIENSAHGLFLQFVGANGDSLSIGIAASCAGIYSIGIFLAAFLAFVLSEFTVFTRRIALLLGIGVLFTYVANLLRMTIVVLAGYYNGMGTMGDPEPFTLLWTHAYAGEIIFICWVALFWWVAFRYFAPVEGADEDMPAAADGVTPENPVEKEGDEALRDDAAATEPKGLGADHDADAVLDEPRKSG